MSDLIQIEPIENESKGEFSCHLLTNINDIKRNFGFLYFNRDHYVFCWDCLIDFSLIENISLCRIPSKLHCGPMFTDASDIKKEFHVICNILHTENDEPKNLEIDFVSSSDISKYLKVLDNHKSVSFIRYDISCFGGSGFHYSVTIENERYPGNSRTFNELAVSQPIEQTITEQLLQYSINTNKSRAALDGNIDPIKSATQLHNYIYTSLNMDKRKFQGCNI